MHQRLSLRALLEVLTADALTNGRAHDLRLRGGTKETRKLNSSPTGRYEGKRQRDITAHLVALAVVLQAARSFAVAAFAVPAV